MEYRYLKETGGGKDGSEPVYYFTLESGNGPASGSGGGGGGGGASLTQGEGVSNHPTALVSEGISKKVKAEEEHSFKIGPTLPLPVPAPVSAAAPAALPVCTQAIERFGQHA